jgi:hypothetical protein
MKYEVINYEENGWIFEVIKSNVKKSFQKLNKIENIKKKKIQIIFHIHFDLIQKIDDSKINIIFITHVDNVRKKLKILFLSKNKNVFFFTLSNDTKILLSYVINKKFIFSSQFFPHLNIKKNNKIRFGFFFRNYKDGRKNISLIKKIIYLISKSNNSQIVIYGSGFDYLHVNNKVKIIDKKFNKSEYLNLLNSCDYVVATGRDEGYVSVIDAASLGIKILAINQGYHKDFALPIGSLLAEDEIIFISILKSLLNVNIKNELKTLDENLYFVIFNHNKDQISYNANIFRSLFFLISKNKFAHQTIFVQIKDLAIYLMKIIIKKYVYIKNTTI